MSRPTAFVKRGVLYKQADVYPADAAIPGEFVCIATFLPVRRWQSVVAFFRMATRVEAQLQRTPGLVRYGLRADIVHKRFWTLSVWTRGDAVMPFVEAEPHRTAVAQFATWAGDGAAFVRWKSSDPSLDWNEALARLRTPTFYYAKPEKSVPPALE